MLNEKHMQTSFIPSLNNCNGNLAFVGSAKNEERRPNEAFGEASGDKQPPFPLPPAPRASAFPGLPYLGRGAPPPPPRPIGLPPQIGLHHRPVGLPPRPVGLPLPPSASPIAKGLVGADLCAPPLIENKREEAVDATVTPISPVRPSFMNSSSTSIRCPSPNMIPPTFQKNSMRPSPMQNGAMMSNNLVESPYQSSRIIPVNSGSSQDFNVEGGAVGTTSPYSLLHSTKDAKLGTCADIAQSTPYDPVKGTSAAPPPPMPNPYNKMQFFAKPTTLENNFAQPQNEQQQVFSVPPVGVMNNNTPRPLFFYENTCGISSSGVNYSHDSLSSLTSPQYFVPSNAVSNNRGGFMYPMNSEQNQSTDVSLYSNNVQQFNANSFNPHTGSYYNSQPPTSNITNTSATIPNAANINFSSMGVDAQQPLLPAYGSIGDMAPFMHGNNSNNTNLAAITGLVGDNANAAAAAAAAAVNHAQEAAEVIKALLGGGDLSAAASAILSSMSSMGLFGDTVGSIAKNEDSTRNEETNSNSGLNSSTTAATSTTSDSSVPILDKTTTETSNAGPDGSKCPEDITLLCEQLSKLDESFMDPKSFEYAHTWYYLDMQQQCQGPFNTLLMLKWFGAGYFQETTQMRRNDEAGFTPVDNGLRLKETAAKLISFARAMPNLKKPASSTDYQSVIPPPPSQPMSLRTKLQNAHAALAPLFELAKKHQRAMPTGPEVIKKKKSQKKEK